MKPDVLPYKKIKLLKPKKYNSLGGPNQVTHKIMTPFPKEFKLAGTLEWKSFQLKSKKYDAIIGMNFLIPFQAKIDVRKQSLEILSKYNIDFVDSEIPCEIAEANMLEAITNSEDVIRELLNRSELNDEEKHSLKNLLVGNKDLFFIESDNLTFTHEITHEIKTIDENSIYCRPYRYPQVHEKEIERQIDEMLRQGIIRESDSPYNAPLWIVPKKLDHSGIKKWRIVIDYRKLNEKTIDDKFPIPNIEGILDRLGRAQYFTTLDLAKGFHQILVNESDRKKTAFSTPSGHFEYVRMPFGLKNAPATFQRLINNILRKYNKICVVYLDDILIFSTSLKEHIDNVNTVLAALRKANLKIQVDKCSFFSKETEYLGHVLTRDGMKPNPAKVSDIVNLKLPETQKQIRSFLGITGYYRKFIKDYAKIAKPMTNYLKKDKHINKSDPCYINSFEELKRLITTHPILKYPDFNKPFKINTDASCYALGAVLIQEGHPIAYASRTLNAHEIRYGTPEKELLGVVWACKYFRPYIYGKEFLLQTDHEALKWLHTKYLGKDLNPRLQRWILSLGEYNIKIDYLKGKDNRIADFLSRINSDTNEINIFSSNSSSDELEQNALNVDSDDSDDSDDDSLRLTIHSQPENMIDHIPIMETIVNRFKNQIILTSEYLELHESVFGNKRIYLDPNLPEEEKIQKLKYFIDKRRVGIFTEIPYQDFNKIQLLLIKEFPDIKFIKCTHFAQDIEDETELFRVIAKQHKELKHPGIIALYQDLKFKIYNKFLRFSINKITNNCDTCCRGKYDRKPIKAKFNKTEIPIDKNEIIHTDIYTNTGNKFITFIDKFSKFATAYPILHPNHTQIIERFRLFFNHKKPKKIVADNGFKDTNIVDFLREEGIEFHLTKPNSHTGNSDIERLHNTLNEKIRILNIEQKRVISSQIIEAVRNYNSIFHSSIQCTPNQAENDITLKDKIYQNLLKSQEKRLEKHNRKREHYDETRQEGYIKYYKSLRHKGQPKYRKYKLINVHPCNIKRPLKFTEDDNSSPSNDDNTTDADSTQSGQN